ncbi:KpsF/GutQ family sugar-phosphate isomerase [Luteibacter anthropi]|uniref:Arabinose 5-phosphate isomerase n=1 Tax=Luteibacter anthropi TaxID=564369 RepID=A0A7X5UEL8_9GAMM|nr:KpsF/GutQ family sugar-phosphate isomerase [Luteibacter anthropi]NII09046.1 KpsF/GutQ family sugar-phosphate isomerase [Luteibacter anthropi]URX62982.1 KpsF/GutQ family sugar-phosphate isomerase [Luteibacter anthropi]
MNARTASHAEQPLVNADTVVRSARTVIATEAAAIRALESRVDAAFVTACQMILSCKGRVVVSGMGKSGHIARKIAATLASTGTPSFFVHPGEASHGDLGMIQPDDILLAISYSGETDELLFILPAIKRQGIPLISITGKPTSSLANQAEVNLDANVACEACPHGLAPTASTTAALVMGDALAVALLEARGFTSDDFARSHPAGSLGRRLLLRISDVMHAGEDVPRVTQEATVSEALVEMTRKHLGMTAVVDAEDRLLGVFTDGDLRRALDDHAVDLRGATVAQLMSRGPKTIGPDKLAGEAAQLMERHGIHSLLVTDDNQRVVGALNIHDLLRARVV